MRFLNNIAIKMLNKYQSATKDSGHRCIYYPSCSEYSKQCYMKFNVFKASFFTGFRIIRCNPLFKGGYNPVPLTRTEKKELKKKKEN